MTDGEAEDSEVGRTRLVASLSPFPHPYTRLTDLPCTDETTAQHMAFLQEGDCELREGRVLAAKHSALPATPSFHILAAGSWSSQVSGIEVILDPSLPLTPTSNHSSSPFGLCSLRPLPGLAPSFPPAPAWWPPPRSPRSCSHGPQFVSSTAARGRL